MHFSDFNKLLEIQFLVIDFGRMQKSIAWNTSSKFRSSPEFSRSALLTWPVLSSEFLRPSTYAQGGLSLSNDGLLVLRNKIEDEEITSFKLNYSWETGELMFNNISNN